LPLQDLVFEDLIGPFAEVGTVEGRKEQVQWRAVVRTVGVRHLAETFLCPMVAAVDRRRRFHRLRAADLRRLKCDM
jgi:hypothetical protein